jgi:choline kinase
MPPIRQALILAAGRGVRMGPRGTLMPKGFIEVGGRTLIERSLALLFEAGIELVSIVTGHLSERYDELTEVYGGRLRCIHNAGFASRGSLESLRLGLEAQQGPCLLLESDLIYERRALDAVLHHDADNVILVSGPTGAGDEVHVWTELSNGRPRFRHMSKQPRDLADAPAGELVGILRLSPGLQQAILDHAGPAAERAEYESGLAAVSRGIAIECVKVDDLVWGEIDDEVMLRRVEREIWPRLGPAQVQ